MEFTKEELTKGLNYLMIVFVVVVFSLFLYNTTDDKTIQSMFENEINSSFNGVVKEKDYDKSNHNTPMLYFSKGTSTSVYGRFWGVIQRGDSISKLKGSYLIYVYRKDSVFTLDNEKLIRKTMKSKGVILDESKITKGKE